MCRAHEDGGIAVSVVSGIKDYFEDALPAMLLYKSEKAQVRGLCIVLLAPLTNIQYEDLDTESTSLCDIYGAEHLLRLFSLLY